MMQRLLKHFPFFCLALMTGMAYADAGTISVTGAWSRATAPGAPVGAAYFVITNQGGQDRLLSAHAPVAERTELHTTLMQDGVMKMRQMDGVDVAGGETVRFAPRGRHVMLIGLKQPLREGATFPLTLTFEKAGAIQVTVQVRAAGHTNVTH